MFFLFLFSFLFFLFSFFSFSLFYMSITRRSLLFSFRRVEIEVIFITLSESLYEKRIPLSSQKFMLDEQTSANFMRSEPARQCLLHRSVYHSRVNKVSSRRFARFQDSRSDPERACARDCSGCLRPRKERNLRASQRVTD